ncbi:Hin recombinase [Bradyrhizobium sp. CNPSo 4026]|nr:Hin recombinase [Bradyrhizobium cenepequi]
MHAAKTKCPDWKIHHRGAQFGRKPKLTKHQTREALKRVEAGEPLREIALSYNVDHSTISRLKTRRAAEAI